MIWCDMGFVRRILRLDVGHGDTRYGLAQMMRDPVASGANSVLGRDFKHVAFFIARNESMLLAITVIGVSKLR